jgi:hypothetical protein
MKFTVKFPFPAVAALAACATLCLTGCFSLEHARSEDSGEEQIIVRNYGWKLFNCIPLVCGSSDLESSFPWVFFRNDVTLDKIQGRLADYAALQGKTAENLAYYNYDTVMLTIPFPQFSLPVPYFLCYNEIQLSARLK